MRPGISRTEDSSTETSRAPANGGRTFRAWTMPGSFTSTAHSIDPSTLAGMSYRGMDWPTIFSACTGFTGARPVVSFTFLPVRATSKRRPPISSPYVAVRVGSEATEMTPSLTLSSSAGTSKRSEASSSRTRLASAATRRAGSASRSIASEPPEPP